MGIGAGWYQHEWEAYGYEFPSAGKRLAMLDEGVQIMREAWSAGQVSFQGKHFQVDGAIVQPRPLQDNRIPLWIAGGGERKTLRIAAKYADYTNFDGTPEVFAHKVRGASPSLCRYRSRSCRDHANGKLQRGDRGDRTRGGRPAGVYPRSGVPVCRRFEPVVAMRWRRGMGGLMFQGYARLSKGVTHE